MADQPDAVEQARLKALEDERLANERAAANDQADPRVGDQRQIDPATGQPIHDIHHPGDIETRKIEQAWRDNPTGIPPGVPGSPGQPTDPPILTGDPAHSPLAADSTEAADHLRSVHERKLGEVDGETKFAVDSMGRRTEEVGTVIDRSVPPEDLAETNEARAEVRAEAERQNAEIQRQAEERQRQADADAKAQADAAQAEAAKAAKPPK